ncbi:MAG: ATP-grasp domain-containing protein [Ignavibacteria bacterium]|nr:ATP-grasp domain-containing protein [Ignavibacteria bacterium]
MEKVNVLITSAGVATAVNLIYALRSSKKYQFTIVAVDMNQYSAGLYLSDKWYLVPQINDPNYIPKILELCKKHNIYILFPLFSKEIIIFSKNLKLFEDEKINILIPSPDIIDICDNKLNFYKFLKNNNFLFPEIIDTKTLDENFTFPLLIKPISGSSTKNVYKIEDYLDLNYYTQKYKNSIIQKFISGTEYTVDCLAIKGETIVAIPRIRILVKDGKSIVGKTVKKNNLMEIARELIKKINFNGPCNIQMIEDANKNIYIIEMNPRFAAGGLTLSVKSGANIPEMIVEYFMGEKLEPIKDFEDELIMIRYFSDIFLETN